ncbi:YqgE/AlgH family protein [Rhodovulum sp. DZ06]|uniref:YqgE/AlgH family protein n=1 Tax=Rhodovulum sp. DZ06 TaxID=3425126 RepID=UPI003D326D4F
MDRSNTVTHDGSLTGSMLIASPAMGDPRFEHTLIYVCAHSEEGAMGLIVNKPSREVDVGDLLQQLKIDKTPDAEGIRVHFGGPVEMGRGFVLHSDDFETPGVTQKLQDGLALTATVEILRAIARGRGPKRAILALGYAGWSSGQLEAEMQANGWLTCPGDPALVFDTEDEAKWAAALGVLGISPSELSATGGTA